MEPVSLAASVITLIGTAKAAESASRSLLLVKHAKTELAFLNNELTDLCATLALVQKVAGRFRNQANEDEVEVILKDVRRASTAIDEVKDAVEKKYSKKNGAVQEVRRLGFLKRERWQRLHRNVKDARDNLRWTLSAMTSFQVNEGLPRLELAISSITTISSPAHAGPVSIVHELQGDASTVIESIAQEASCGASDEDDGSTRTDQVTFAVKPTDNTPMIQIQATSVQQCYRFCPCQCHASRVRQSPRWLRGMVGMLFYQYTASPTYTHRSCDYESCKATKSSTTFEYVFPKWVGPWILNINGVVDQLGSWSGVWNLRAPVYALGPAGALIDLLYSPLCDSTQVGRFMARYSLPAYAVSPYTHDSLLDTAFQRGNVDVCHFLLDHGADLYHQRRGQLTTGEFLGTYLLLHNANQNSKVASLIRKLEIAGVYETFDFSIPHRMITGAERISMDSWLHSHPKDIEVRDAWGNTPMIWAARLGRHDMIETLLRFGAEVNARNHYDETPLHEACDIGKRNDTRLACVRTLIQAGADVDALNGQPEFCTRSPLAYAVDFEDYALVDLLLESGAHPDPPGWSPLSVAAGLGRKDMLERLLNSNADLNRQDCYGTSPIMDAIYHDRVNCVELLIERGARLDLRDNDGLGILWYAVRAGVEVLQLLSQAGIRDNLEYPTFAQYWKGFEDYRKSEIFYRHDSIEEERLAFQELLDSVIEESEDEDDDSWDTEDEFSEDEDDEDMGSGVENSDDEFADAMEELDLA